MEHNLTISAICTVIPGVLAGASAGITVGGVVFSGATVIKECYENNNPNAKQCWLKSIWSSNSKIDFSFDSTTY